MYYGRFTLCHLNIAQHSLNKVEIERVAPTNPKLYTRFIDDVITRRDTTETDNY